MQQALSQLHQQEAVGDADLLIAALQYWRRGFAPIPVNGKTAMVKWKQYQDRCPDLPTVSNWFTHMTPTGIALVTGASSGLVAVDEDIVGSLAKLGVHLPPTPTERSPRGGYHRWYRHPGPGIKVATMAGLVLGVDIRGDGGYAVVAPSPGYSWCDGLSLDDLEFAPLPTWVMQHLEKRAPAACGVGNAAHVSGNNTKRSIDKDSGPSNSTVSWSGRVDAHTKSSGSPSAASGVDIALLPDMALLMTPRSPLGQLESLAAVPEVAFTLLRLCGVEVDALGKKFCCPLPGHQEKSPSAALWQLDSDRPIMMHDFHTRLQLSDDSQDAADNDRIDQDKATAPQEWWQLSDVYAAVKAGRARRLKRGQRALWWLRFLAEAKIVTPPTVAAPKLTQDAPETARKLWDGFLLCVALRTLYDADQKSAPYSWHFARGWVGLKSQRKVQEGMNWLLDRGYLSKADKTPRGITLYAIGWPA